MAVLIVDDDTRLRRLVSGVCRVIAVSSAAKALKLLESLQVDVIISHLDLRYRTRDGIWLLRQVARLHPIVRRVLYADERDDRVRASQADGLIQRLLVEPATRAASLDAIIRTEGSPPTSRAPGAAFRSHELQASSPVDRNPAWA